MKKRGLGSIIDRGLVAVIILISAAAVSYAGGTMLAIAHMQPFHHCSYCEVCNSDSCENMVAVDTQQKL